jgi:hypothetical protein
MRLKGFYRRQKKEPRLAIDFTLKLGTGVFQLVAEVVGIKRDRLHRSKVDQPKLFHHLRFAPSEVGGQRSEG